VHLQPDSTSCYFVSLLLAYYRHVAQQCAVSHPSRILDPRSKPHNSFPSLCIPLATRCLSADIPEGHRSYWEANGGSPNPDSFFPGFEAGWKATCEALSNGQQAPNSEDQGKSDDEWEWKHGFKKGTQDAEQAGSN
jgi:hypothetical protein